MRVCTSKRILIRLGSILLPVLVLSSCYGDGVGLTSSGIPENELGFASTIQPIFDDWCVGCHVPGGIGFIDTGGAENSGLVLSAGNSYGSLVNKPTFGRPSTEPKFRVVPGNPEASYLLDKITSDAPKEGVRMPTKGPPWVSDREVELIEAWIRAGANFN